MRADDFSFLKFPKKLKIDAPYCTVLKVVVYISLSSLLSLEEESGEPGRVEESSGVPAVGPVGEIVKSKT